MTQHLTRLSASLSFFAALAAATPAQQDLLTVNGNSRGDQFGFVVTNAGDVNNDGRDDIAVGIPFDNTSLIDSGRVRVYSGATGGLLWSRGGEAAGDELGYSLAAIGDANGDGFDDIVAGAPFNDANGSSSGKAYVLSGQNGSILTTFTGTEAGARFGWSVGNAGVVSGLRRVIIGAPYKDNGSSAEGSAFLYSWSGGLIHEYLGSQSGEHFGYAVAGGFDTNGGGTPDVVIGSPDYDDGGTDDGRAKVYSAGSASWGLLTTLFSAGPGHRFGYSVAMLQDANGDALADVLVGAPEFVSGQGAAYLHSGPTGAILFTKTGNSSGDHFGTSVASAGDPNNDGRTDFIVGAPDDTTNGPSGSAVLYSGLNGVALHTFSSTLAGGEFGFSVGGGGDVNGDGREDLIVGAPYADLVGTDAGNVKVFSGLNYSQLYNLDGLVTGDATGTSVCSLGDVNGDGHADFLVGSPADDHTVFFLIPFSSTIESAGSVRCISGATGATLYTVWGDAEGDELGFSVAKLGDVNGDGIPDFIAGAPQRKTTTSQPGYARVYSGATGTTIRTHDGNAGLDFEYGYCVASAGKLTADAVPDVAIGAPGYSADRGRVALFDGATGAAIGNAWSFGVIAGERFGTSLASLGDVTGDGRAELLIGAPSNDSVGADAGRVYCMPGSAAGGFVFTLSGTSAGDQFGTSVCSMGDYTADGITDLFAVGAPGVDYLTFTNIGYVRSYFVTTLSNYWTAYGVGSNDGFGYSLANLGDFNNDGFDDVIGGARELAFPISSPGYAQIVSGYYGWTLFTFHGDSLNDAFGTSVSGAGDVNADGIPDVVIGAPGDDPSGSGSGSAKVISLQPVGVIPYGASTPGCQGPQTMRANSVPKIANSYFEYGVDRCPPGALGLLLISDSQGNGTDPFGIGVGLWVDFFAATQVLGIDIYATVEGNGLAITPVPSAPGMAGMSFYSQTLWVWGTCSLPPYNVSASNALKVTLQP